MSLVSMKDLLDSAREGKYAVGYFESWNLESILAVTEAAEQSRSPVIIGFNGSYLENPARSIPENLSHYAALGLSMARQSRAPMALLLNEAEELNTLKQGLEAGFNAVMCVQSPGESWQDLVQKTRRLVETARSYQATVEGEVGELPWGDRASGTWHGGEKTDPVRAQDFVEQTGVEALSVAVGNVHVLETGKVSLDFSLIDSLHQTVSAHLVLHGGTGIAQEALREAIRLGVSKVNVGTLLRRSCLNILQARLCSSDIDTFEPQEVLGSGGEKDILRESRDQMREEVIRFMSVLGSTGKA